MRTLLLTVCCLVATPAAFSSDVDYMTDIKPLLRKRCFSCHGPLRQEGGLRLDTVATMLSGGDSGAALVGSDASGSLIVERVAAEDPDYRMPPAHEGEPFSPEELQVLNAWINGGAAAPSDEQPDADPRSHWSFQPIVRPEVPTVSDIAWSDNPIDAFIAARYETNGVQPQESADGRQLMRRLTFDLIGLPPTPEQVDFAAAPTSDDWYEKTVDELLADPRHGERWGRHWMDIWRYSDWWGLNAQLRRSQHHIWHWRDWIVESLNDNKPYDEMVREMLAADELYPNDPDRLRATGYLARNFHLFNRQQWMDETIEHVSKSLLGLTMNCAKCHDHKFDPIDQADYYRMKAIFEPYMVRVDVIEGETNVTNNGIPCVFDARPDEPTYRLERGQESHPDKSVAMTPGVPGFLPDSELQIEQIGLPAAAWQTARRPWVIEEYLAAARSRVEQTQRRADQLRREANESNAGPSTSDAESVPSALEVADLAVAAAKAELHSREARAAAMRAEWETDSDQTPSSLNETAIQAERTSSLEKARHAVAAAKRQHQDATDKTRPAAKKKLTAATKQLEMATKAIEAKVTEDDQYTPIDGTRWTPTRFAFSGNDDPHPGYPTYSTGRRTALARWITDASNPLAARVAVNHIWTRHMGQPLVATVFDLGLNGSLPTHPQLLDWLAAELIESGWNMKHVHRLIVTSRAYRLSSSVAGNEAAEEDPDNQLFWRRVPLRLESQAIRDSVLALAGQLDETRGGPTIAEKDQPASRRRSLYFFHSNNSRNLMLTTFDEAGVNECYQRETSVVPQQALALTNGRLIRDSAAPIATRLLDARDLDDTQFVQRAFGVLLAMTPDDDETSSCLEALKSWRELPDTSHDDAYRLLVWALINHNDFVTIR